MLDLSSGRDERVRALRDPATIRARCRTVLAWVEGGHSPHFTVDRGRLPAVAARVVALTRERFPALAIPYHSRWRHFEAGGIDRKAELDAALHGRTHVSVARSRIDLALISVLLDAGAGPDWSYVERPTQRRFARSEGLAVATFRAFVEGRFSSDAGDRLRVDALALTRMHEGVLAEIFQVHEGNPLVGLEGRAAMLRRLGQALRLAPQTFSALGQPGHLFDALTHHRHAPELQRHGHHPLPRSSAHQHHVAASRILGALLGAFSGIWPQGRILDGVPLGDVWPHPAIGGDGLVPFHKLSQWLTYSLIEPFEWAGVQVTAPEDLTGLPEYRNGGLLLDGGVIVPRDPAFAEHAYRPGDAWVVEWRALTVALLDLLALEVRQGLGPAAAALPLACVLEGGTWAAGRQIAAERRPGGAPPVSIVSDGTVF